MIVLYYFQSKSDNESIIPVLTWSSFVACYPADYYAYADIKSGRESYLYVVSVAFQIAYALPVWAILFDKNIFVDYLTPINISILMFITTMFGFIIAAFFNRKTKHKY